MSKKKRNPHDKRRITRRTLREWGFGYLFIAPWIVGVSIFFLYAMVRSLEFSFSKVELSNGVILHPLENGLFENFVKVFTTDVNFPGILANFGVGLVLQLPVIIATGPVMSKLTAQGVSSVPMVSQNALLSILSELPEFIYQPISNLFSGLIMILWNSGIQILIFLAGLQKVPRTLYEAAKIDGASGWESFWKITLPTVKPLILLNSIYTVVTLATGGSNEIIELIYTATYTATQGYSYAMAMSWIYTLVVSVILLLVFLLLREKSDRHVVYEQKRVVIKGVPVKNG